MDITQWYAIALGGLVSLFITGYLLLIIVKVARTYATVHFLKHVFYPQIHRYLRGSGKTTPFDAILIMVFLVGNILCITIRVKDIPELVRRSGLMSTINLMPLSLGAHMNLIASGCGLRLDVYARIHRWLGRTAIIEGLVHTAAAASLHTPNLRERSDIAALTASITMIAVLLSAIGSVRRRMYEIFSKLHLILAAVVITAIYLHSPSQNLLKSPTVYLLVAVCLQTLTAVLRLGQILYRNAQYGKPFSRAEIRAITFRRPQGGDIPVLDAVHVHVRLSRPWEPQAGQYVYLCIPGLSYTSFAQAHPFYVSWWYRDGEGNTVVVLIVQKRRGFTETLFLHAGNGLGSRSKTRAVIEGPYGKELDLGSYGTVLLFATGIGIAGQLPYVTQLLEGYPNCEVKTRRIALFWELDSELHAAWVADMMKELLKRDTKRILDIQLFVLSNFLSTETSRGDNTRLGERIKMTYEAMNAENLIKSEIEERKGRTVVSLCTNDEKNNKIREIVRRMLDKDIHLKELDFRPYSPTEPEGYLNSVLLRKRVKRKIDGV